jgi:hypothetical protein
VSREFAHAAALRGLTEGRAQVGREGVGVLRRRRDEEHGPVPVSAHQMRSDDAAGRAAQSGDPHRPAPPGDALRDLFETPQG